jgi:hypothetical protein
VSCRVFTSVAEKIYVGTCSYGGALACRLRNWAPAAPSGKRAATSRPTGVAPSEFNTPSRSGVRPRRPLSINLFAGFGSRPDVQKITGYCRAKVYDALWVGELKGGRGPNKCSSQARLHQLMPPTAPLDLRKSAGREVRLLVPSVVATERVRRLPQPVQTCTAITGSSVERASCSASGSRHSSQRP